MAYAKPASVYKENQVTTASPKQLVILLYQAAVKNMRLAELAIDSKENDKVNKHLIKAQDIIQELASTLNFEQGGEVAQNLADLYAYLLPQLIQANIKKDKEKIEQCRKIMNELLEAWNAI
ncbi:flagellar export chaperone FliS [Lacticigenium naphthae]|uniref:flagellar export chaperone FliS n=1 Tax=Lacticigenium naphthae TaxID=515351 RepID=UPI000409E363|nr:flagellar export chaperone FliS [Lacticigenium naphthae]